MAISTKININVIYDCKSIYEICNSAQAHIQIKYVAVAKAIQKIVKWVGRQALVCVTNNNKIYNFSIVYYYSKVSVVLI